MKKIFIALAMLLTVSSTLLAEKASAAAINWTYLSEGSTTGYTLQSGYYYVTKNIEFSDNRSLKSGLYIADGATVHLYLPAGVTLTAKGGNAEGQSGAGAGIYLPSGSTLYIEGRGKVIAQGGNAANGSNGSNGTNGDWNEDDGIWPGDGGAGGNGGGGAGAGIGTPGGTGGNGGAGGARYWSRDWKDHSGVAGKRGSSGGSAAAMGRLFVDQTFGVKVEAKGGKQGARGGSGGARGWNAFRDGGNNYSMSGGGGGGGGGYGGAANSIGTGGPGGGGGGGGSSGSTCWKGSGFYQVGANGGLGGYCGDGDQADNGANSVLDNVYAAEIDHGTRSGSYSNGGWHNDARTGDAGAAGGKGADSQDWPADKEYLIRLNVLNKNSGSADRSRLIGYYSNTRYADVTITVPTNNELGFTNPDKYVTSWTSQANGSGSSIGAYDDVKVTYGVHNYYATWKDYKDIFPRGKGTQAQPFMIEYARLLTFADYVNDGGNTKGVYFKQEGNILIPDVLKDSKRGENWIPIGHTRVFEGDYDGGGYIVRKVKIASNNLSNALGVFGKVTGCIHDFGVDGGSISTVDNNTRCGAIAGMLTRFDIERNEAGSIYNCYAANISLNASYSGGLVGEMAKGTSMRYCHTFNPSFGSKHAGGLSSLIDNDATVHMCFTTYRDLSSDGYSRSTNSESRVSNSRMAEGSLTWLLNNRTAFGVTWYQDLANQAHPDACPVLNVESSRVFSDGEKFSNERLGLYALPGEGTSEAPYLISSLADMEKLANYCNDGNKSTGINFLLTTDLDLNGGKLKPIACGEKASNFDGYFDGGGHTIRNGVVDTTGVVGIFGNVTGTVARLGVEKMAIKYAADDGRAGGISGRVSGHGRIINCSVRESEISNNGKRGVAGAIVADVLDYASVTNCFGYRNTVTATRIGYICSDMDENAKLERCYTDGQTLVTTDRSYAKGSTGESLPGMSAATLRSGEIAYLLNNRQNSPEPAWFQTISMQSGNDDTPVLSSSHSMVFNRDGVYTNDWKNISRLGSGTKEDPYKIAQPVDLEDLIISIGLMKRSDFYIVQTADLNLTDSVIVPIGTCTKGFEGHYDGGGHVIKNMHVRNYLGENVGLFNNIIGVVERLGIENSTFVADASTTRLGAFAGKMSSQGVLRNCYVKNSTIDYNRISGTATGAMVGEQADTSRIESCFAYRNTVSGQSDGKKHYGYIVGYIGRNATDSLVFTDGPSLCADGQIGADNIVRSEKGVTDERLVTGEISSLLSGLNGDNTAWYQTIKKDSIPLLDASHKPVYRHILEKQVMFTNEKSAPEVVSLSLNANYDDNERKNVFAFRANDGYYVPDFKFESYALERDYFYFAGWNTRADGKGTFYPYDGKLLPSDNTALYAVWDMKVPADGEGSHVTLREDTTFFRVYDNGGAISYYGRKYSGKLEMTAPDNHVICLSGTITTEAAGSDNKLRDYMIVYDGDEDSKVKLTNEFAKHGDDYNDVFFSTADGVTEDIGHLMSKGTQMSIEFITNDEVNFKGLDLKVHVLPKAVRALGSGTKDAPFKVKSVADLKTVDEYIRITGDSKIYVQQTADIDLNGESFDPLASSVESFEGYYDGGGHVIRNGVINTVALIGIFRQVTGTVTRLGVENMTVKNNADAHARVGGIAGRLRGNGEISNCYVKGCTMIGDEAKGVAGAIVADMYDNAAVRNCLAFQNKVTAVSAGHICGEMASDSTLLYRCYTDGSALVNSEIARGTTQESETGTAAFDIANGTIAYLLNKRENNALGDSVIWRQTIGIDSHPLINTTSQIVYSYNDRGVQGYTNQDTPTILELELEDIVTDDYKGFYVFKGMMVDMGSVLPEHRHFVFKGWNTDPDGNGEHYPTDSLLVYNDPLKLYTEWDMVVNMSKNDTEKISEPMPLHIPYAKVYDDGGSSDAYTAGTRYVTLTAPEGHVLQVKGTVASKAADAAGTAPQDYLAVYDGNYAADLSDGQKAANGAAKSGNGWQYVYYSTTAGEPYDIGTLSSSGREMTLLFQTTGQDDSAFAGLDLTVYHVPVDSAVSALGKGTDAEPYRVTTTADLKNLATFSNQKGINAFSAKQMGDIDMEGMSIQPLFNDSAYFAGHYDGGGHIIRNMKMEGYKGVYVGLFGIVSGTVENLGIENSTFKTVANDARAGVLAGGLMGGGVLRNCYVKGSSVSFNDARGVVGALVGEQTDTSRVESCLAFRNTVYGYKEKNGKKRFGYIVGDIEKTATMNNVFTDGPSLCSDGLEEGTNLTNAHKDVNAEQMASGEVCYWLNASKSDNVHWYQTLNADSVPVFDNTHGVVYYHLLGDDAQYSNSATPEVYKLHLVDVVDSNGSKDIDVLRGGKKRLAGLDMTHQHFVFKGWNTHADGTGTAYTSKDAIVMNGDSTLYSQWDMAVVMSKDVNEKISLNIPQAIPFAKVYDDGGADSTYTAGTRYVTLTAPEGMMLRLTGTVATRTAPADSIQPADYLAVFDGNISAGLSSNMQLSNSLAKSGKSWKNLYYSNVPGDPYDIGKIISSGREMTIVFHADSLTNTAYEGLDLTVMPVPIDSIMIALGQGTEAEPFEIATRGDLKKLADYVNKTAKGQFYVKQVADIDLTGETMEPIGTNEHRFLGTYDGGGHTITVNFRYIQEGSVIFGCVGEGAVIKNLTTTGRINTTAKYVGGLVSEMYGGTLSRCYSTVEIYIERDGLFGRKAVGGLVGSVRGGNVAITDCAFAGRLDGDIDQFSRCIGGLVGEELADQLTIENCYVAGSQWLTLDDAIVGDRSNRPTVKNCYYLNRLQVKQNLPSVEPKSAEEFASGQVCYLLNGSDGDSLVWRQTLGTDPLPVFGESHSPVNRLVNEQTAQVAYSNTQDVPETVTITLHQNDGSDKTQTIFAYRQHSEGEAGMPFALNPGWISFEGSLSSKVIKWTEQADGKGTSYTAGQLIKPFSDMELYAQWDSLAICIPSSGRKTINIPATVTSVKVYDDGGPDGNYGRYSDGELQLIAPDTCALMVTGTTTTGGWPGYGRNPFAYLTFLDDENNKLSNDRSKSWSKSDECKNIYWSAYPGQTESVGQIVSSNNVITLKFRTNGGGRAYSGLDLDVKMMSSPYFINSKEEFMAFANKKGDVRLNKDIDLGEWSGNNFYLNGNFDGGGHTITYSSSNECKGLFTGIREGASLSHLRVEANVVTMRSCGGIAGSNAGSISDCHFNGNIRSLRSLTSASSIAGIALSSTGTIDHCSATGSLIVMDSVNGRAYPICNAEGVSVEYCTWVSPTDQTLYAAQADSAMSVQADYPVYAKGVLDVTAPKVVLGNDTITMAAYHLDSLTIIDGQRFSGTSGVKVDKITYQRQGTNSAYEPWVLPFAYTIDADMFKEGVEFYCFDKDSTGNIQVYQIPADTTYQVAANEPLAFRSASGDAFSFQMKLVEDGATQPLTIQMPIYGIAASISSTKDIARLMVTYDSIAAEKTVQDLMYVWNDKEADFLKGDGTSGLLPFRYYLQYVEKSSGRFEQWEQTEWASRQTNADGNGQQALKRIARRAPLAEMTDQGWQAIVLDPRGSQTITAEILADYDVLALYDLYDAVATGTADRRMAVKAVYVPVEEGMTLDYGLPLLVRAKHGGAEPLVTEQMGREIAELLRQAEGHMSEEDVQALEQAHYWCSTFAGRYDVWQLELPETNKVLNDFGALAFNDGGADQYFYRVGAGDDYRMQPMSYCFTAYDAKTYENLPLANDRIEIVVMALPDDATGIGDVQRSTFDVQRPASDVRRSTFNIQGQKVDDSYRGIIIKNGRKILKR